jgi:hypothetical protein
MPVELPQEIIDIIVDHLDRGTLLACTLVSKSWVTRAQYHIFACARFSGQHDLHDTRRWSSCPHLCELVKRIIIGYGQPSAIRHQYQLFLATAFYDQPIRGPFLEHISLFPNVTSLNLNFVKFDTPLDAFNLVAGFARLHQLQWKDVCFENLEQNVVPSVSPPSSICDLCVIFNGPYRNIEPFIEWLTSHSQRIRLETLVVGWPWGSTQVSPFINTWASTLKTLDMSEVLSMFSIYLTICAFF